MQAAERTVLAHDRSDHRLGIRHIALAVADIDALVADLKADGVGFFGAVQTYPETGKRLVYFYGPVSKKWDLIQS